MRDLLSKLMTGSMIASAALLVSACGKTESADNAANVTEMNAEDSMMNGTTNDTMTNTDAAMGADANMAADANATNAADANATDANATNASNAM